MQVIGDWLKKRKHRFHPKTFCTRRMSFTRGVVPAHYIRYQETGVYPVINADLPALANNTTANAPLQEDVVFPAKFLEWGAGGGTGGGVGGLCAPMQKT